VLVNQDKDYTTSVSILAPAEAEGIFASLKVMMLAVWESTEKMLSGFDHAAFRARGRF